MNYRIVDKETFDVIGVHRDFSLCNGENMRLIRSCGMKCMRTE